MHTLCTTVLQRSQEHSATVIVEKHSQFDCVNITQVLCKYPATVVKCMQTPGKLSLIFAYDFVIMIRHSYNIHKYETIVTQLHVCICRKLLQVFSSQLDASLRYFLAPVKSMPDFWLGFLKITVYLFDCVFLSAESEQDRHQIFLSYQWDSQDEVKVLRDKLERSGFLCWMDIGQLGGGDQLYNKIDEALRHCKVCYDPGG